jgi:hypothetical protein
VIGPVRARARAVCASALARWLLIAGVQVSLAAPSITYAPYIQPGDAGALGAPEQIVIAWQSDESTPHSSAYKVEFGQGAGLDRQASVAGRIVDQYLAAERALPIPPTAYGPHTNYVSKLRGLALDTVYSYRVSGPGLPAAGFRAQFRARKTGGEFSFLVLGDEGFFPGASSSGKPLVNDFFARIVHLMYNAAKIALPGEPRLPPGDFAIITGDHAYNTGAEDSYRDFLMPVWNSDVDSVDRGAPFMRSIQCYVVVGNHDIGGSGDFVNLLATAGAARYAGQTGGGDALGFFNNYYLPLNGPLGVDPFAVWDGDHSSARGFFFSYEGRSYEAPRAAAAYRASTLVNTGSGARRQIEQMSNYSFDYGNAHFVFLDSNPHLFNAQVESNVPTYAGPLRTFSAYPGVLRKWLIEDLDGSPQPWKIVVFHHASFSSGNATLRNFQMRQIAQLLEEHGVSLVLNGHEHNYQRTRPLRATPRVANVPGFDGTPAVSLDERFDGDRERVPDGIVYLVEGAGGNRDFDGDEPQPRGQGVGIGIDQDDSASGMAFAADGHRYAQGPASWLDDHLSNTEMAAYLPGAGSGPKITVKFKAKVFSFGELIVANNRLTLYQISEPLGGRFSGTPAHPAPYGVDFHGKALNDPLPETQIDPTTARIISPQNEEGSPVVLDRWSIEKPNLQGAVNVRRVAAASGIRFIIEDHSAYALNGAQLVLRLPRAACYRGPRDDRHTLRGERLVLTVGRIERGQAAALELPLADSSECAPVSAELRSATALPIAITDQSERR